MQLTIHSPAHASDLSGHLGPLPATTRDIVTTTQRPAGSRIFLERRTCL